MEVLDGLKLVDTLPEGETIVGMVSSGNRVVVATTAQVYWLTEEGLKAIPFDDGPSASPPPS